MKCLVVYESIFGNTKKVAEMICETVGEECSIKHVDNIEIDEVFDLIFIGSPTRAFKPTKNIVGFVKRLPLFQNAKKVALFDTRFDINKHDSKLLKYMVRKFGYSNDTLTKLCNKDGIIVIGEPGEFFVDDTEGPLGEEEFLKITKWTNDIMYILNKQ